jgi:predicted PurR-regulated permease PerM
MHYGVILRSKCILNRMDLSSHLRITGTALKNWFIAQTMDALAVGVLWLVGLLIVGIPWAPLWALLGGLFQYVPNIGPALSLIGPVVAGALSGNPERGLYVLIVYAIIVVIDGLILQPYFMKRTSKVPIWASLLMPFAMWLLLPVWWGVVIAAPLLAVVYAYRAYHQAQLEARANRAGPKVVPFPTASRVDSSEKSSQGEVL